MPKRILLTLIIILFPLGAAADTATASASDVNSGLGPQTTIANPSSSSAAATALQPAGLSPLQSTTVDAAGLTAPSSVLQAPVTGDDALKVLAGETDGAAHNTADAPASPWGWLAFTLVFALIAAASSVVVRDRRRFRRPN